jgi:hypothetical protein
MANPFDTKTKSGGTATATKTKGGLDAANGEEAPVAVGPRDPFALPSTGGGGDYKFTDFMEELLLIRPTSEDVMSTSVSAETEVIRADVVRLDNDNEQVEDLFVFQSALIRNLRKVLRGPNEWVLGRLTKGTAKPGKSAPYILDQPNADEIARAQTVMVQLGLL